MTRTTGVMKSDIFTTAASLPTTGLMLPKWWDNLSVGWWNNITHLVATYSYEGSLEEDAELRECAGGKSVALYVSGVLGEGSQRSHNTDKDYHHKTVFAASQQVAPMTTRLHLRSSRVDWTMFPRFTVCLLSQGKSAHPSLIPYKCKTFSHFASHISQNSSDWNLS